MLCIGCKIAVVTVAVALGGAAASAQQADPAGLPAGLGDTEGRTRSGGSTGPTFPNPGLDTLIATAPPLPSGFGVDPDNPVVVAGPSAALADVPGPLPQR
jgi:hypothetical protein